MGGSWHCNVLLLLMALAFQAVCTYSIYDQQEFLINVQDKKYHVDYFVLATEWPQGTCEFTNATHRHNCVVPAPVTGWVLHGLWPSLIDPGGRKHLGYCNNSMKFDYAKVRDLETQLLRYWPNLYKDGRERMFLWKHEYEKHGTCAALVKGFETEHLYFSKAMEYLHKHDPELVLKNADITPSANGYDSDRILRAANQGYGVRVCPQCSYARGVRALSGLEVCLTKQLELMDCPHDCYRKYHCDGNVFYHPLHFHN